MTRTPALSRRLAAEFVATALLLATIVGSGIMGESLAAGNAALALLANSLATGCMLAVLIVVFGDVSGAHMNPLVSCLAALRRELAPGEWGLYMLAQVAGALAGVALAHVMFDQALFSWSEHERSGAAQLTSEAVASFGLILTVLACARRRPAAAPLAVGAYVTAAYWFCASTSFANPVVTIARATTNTFVGLRPGDVGGFVVAQCVGAALAARFARWLYAPEISARDIRP